MIILIENLNLTHPTNGNMLTLGKLRRSWIQLYEQILITVVSFYFKTETGKYAFIGAH